MQLLTNKAKEIFNYFRYLLIKYILKAARGL